jgi:hypothetical protein
MRLIDSTQDAVNLGASAVITPAQEMVLKHRVGAQQSRPRVPDESEHEEILPDAVAEVLVFS